MKKVLLITLAYIIYILAADMSDAFDQLTGLGRDTLIAFPLGLAVALFMYGTYGGNPIKYIPTAFYAAFILMGVTQVTTIIVVAIDDPQYLLLAIEYIGGVTLAGLAVVWIGRKLYRPLNDKKAASQRDLVDGTYDGI